MENRFLIFHFPFSVLYFPVVLTSSRWSRHN